MFLESNKFSNFNNVINPNIFLLNEIISNRTSLSLSIDSYFPLSMSFYYSSWLKKNPKSTMKNRFYFKNMEKFFNLRPYFFFKPYFFNFFPFTDVLKFSKQNYNFILKSPVAFNFFNKLPFIFRLYLVQIFYKLSCLPFFFKSFPTNVFLKTRPLSSANRFAISQNFLFVNHRSLSNDADALEINVFFI